MDEDYQVFLAAIAAAPIGAWVWIGEGAFSGTNDEAVEYVNYLYDFLLREIEDDRFILIFEQLGSYRIRNYRNIPLCRSAYYEGLYTFGICPSLDKDATDERYATQHVRA